MQRFPHVLHFAVMSGNLEIVKLLCDYGGDVYSGDAIYGNVFHLAVCFKFDVADNYKMIELLLQYGADPNLGVVNPNQTYIRPPVVEFFRRLYKYHLESGEEYKNWVQILKLLFSYGARFEINAENLDVNSMAIPTAKPWPKFAENLNFYLTEMASGVGSLDGVEVENSIYLSKEQVEDLKK